MCRYAGLLLARSITAHSWARGGGSGSFAAGGGDVSPSNSAAQSPEERHRWTFPSCLQPFFKKGIILIRRLNICILRKAVIPAKAGIQGLSGCRIKSGMTSYLIAGVIEKMWVGKTKSSFSALMRFDDDLDRLLAFRHQFKTESDIGERKPVRDQIINNDVTGFDQFHCPNNIRWSTVV